MSSIRLKIEASRPEQHVVLRAVASLGKGGVIAYPTETFYGLGASAFDVDGCRRVFEVKGRAPVRSLPLILADLSQLAQVSTPASNLTRRLAERFWPGPLTLVVPALPAVAAASDDGTVAVRVSGLAVARELASAWGPVTSTSANLSGAPPATTAERVEAELGERIDIILDGGETAGGLPSTIVDVSGVEPTLVREGRIAFRDVLDFA